MVSQTVSNNRDSKKGSDSQYQQKQNQQLRTIDGQSRDHPGTTSAMSSGANSSKANNAHHS